MQASPELVALTRKSFEDMAARNVPALMATLSRDPNIISIGTAPGEWWQGIEAIAPIVQISAESNSGRVPADLVIQAFEEGTVGWTVSRWTFVMPDGRALEANFTSVWHREDGEWRVVNNHQAIAVPDELIPTIAQPRA